VNGIDAKDNSDWLRKHVGVCPQHDVLYDELTAREHIELFGFIKGDFDVDGALNGVDMMSKADELVSSFSGGQKRRLSVALALLGSPAVVVLDEPTTGMDVITRQSVWKSIERLKQNAHTTVILTTHAMEEADALGDNIVVMSRGRVQAHGTSLDLKARFGVGFHLHAVKKSDGDFSLDRVMEVLKQHVDAVDSIEVLTNVGAECSFTLPAETSKFPDLFTDLQNKKDELNLEQVALSMTTLEEVFLKLGQEEEEADKKAKEEKEEKEAKAKEEGTDDKKKAGDAPTAAQEEDSLKVSDEVLASGIGKYKVGGAASSGSWAQQVKGAALLNLYSKKRNPMSSCAICIQPIMFVCIAGAIHLSTGGDPLALEQVFPYGESKPTGLAYSSDSIWGNQLVSNASALFGITAPKSYDTRSAMETALTAGNGKMDIRYAISVISSNYQNVTVHFNDTADSDEIKLRETIALIQNSMVPTEKQCTPAYLPLAKGDTVQVNAAEWSSGGIMILAALPIAFMSAYYGEQLVRDRAGGNRIHLFVSSLRRTQYYVGAFLSDFSTYWPVAVLTPLLLFAFQFEGVAKTNLWAFFILFLFFAPSVIAFGYLLSWIFDDIQVAQEWFGELVNFSLSIPFLITSFVILDATELGHTICGIIPGYAVYRGMGVIESEAKAGNPYLTFGDIFDTDRSLAWVLIILVIDAVLFWALVCVAEYTEMRWKWMKDAYNIRKAGSASNEIRDVESGIKSEQREPDERVKEEIAWIDDANDDNSKKVVKLEHISKTFVMNSGKLNHAVRDVCLGIEDGTIFGLLGMNGAGKTTLLHSIQGKHAPTSGDCVINGHSCVKDLEAVRQLFGITPQHDILWEFVTPREHLRAFAHIRGVPEAEIENTVQQLLARLDLLPKAEEMASTLSGGQKRRLSIAMGVIGNPKVIFLDEPTTGLDPNTRRFVWDYIMEIKEGRVVVLTTHSMEEADALCNRIGIMVNGRLMSLGTPQQLKGAYGAGYNLIVRLKAEGFATAGKLWDKLEGMYGSKATFADHNSSEGLRVYNICDNDLDLGELFRLLEENREGLFIEDYSITQTTMEQVFTKFAQFQKEEEGPTK
jgi:ABC-type multidrug transport system ATPase subunit